MLNAPIIFSLFPVIFLFPSSSTGQEIEFHECLKWPFEWLSGGAGGRGSFLSLKPSIIKAGYRRSEAPLDENGETEVQVSVGIEELMPIDDQNKELTLSMR